MYKRDKIFIFTLYLFILINKEGFFNKCYASSEEFKIGYTSCIINDIVPEEKLDFYIKNDELYISFLKREPEPSTKEKLLQRLQKTKLFHKINIIKGDAGPSHIPPQESSVLASHDPQSTLELLPEGVIYDSPLADPKWPRFSAGYARSFKNRYGKNNFNFSFGENDALIRYKTDGWSYEVGIQASLTGLMDISSSPTRLINSDYFIGAGLSFSYNRRWQNLIQFSHLSSHLGDEFLISRPHYINKRVNLSYEALKWFTAYKFNSFRPYIGIGYLVDRDPATLKPFTLEGGLDYFSEEKFLYNTTRYVFGIYTHLWNQNNFKQSLSIRTGLQLENPIWGGRHLQFLMDYAYGQSRHGQFYAKRDHYIGFIICLSN